MTPGGLDGIFSSVAVVRRGERQAPAPIAGTERGEQVEPRKVTNSGVVDTSPEMESVLVAGYRRMDGYEKLRRVASLNRSVEQLARARIRAQYGDGVTEREMRLRLATLRLGRRLMIEAFGWDPLDQGY